MSRKKTIEPKYPPVTALANWLSGATDELRTLLAKLADTNPCMYRQWVVGRRGVSAEKAGALEMASHQIKKDFPGAPEPLLRGDLCEACKNCDYFKDRLL